MKFYFTSPAERRAISWVKANYGRAWRKRISETVSEGERSFPYPNLRGHVSRPFGRRDFNVMMAHARNCYRRNVHFRDLAKRLGAP